MAKLHFENISIKAIVTTIGDKKITIEEEAKNYGYDEKMVKRLKKRMGFNSRYVVSDKVCTSDLCCQSAEKIFEKFDKSKVEALIFVTQTPDYKAPSTAFIMQDRLKLSKEIVAYDINLGCSGFISGLLNAYSLINSGLNSVLLCVGDIASNFSYYKDKNLTPLMGDAGSAILIEKGLGDGDFVLYSDGGGYKHLIIPEGGCKNPFSEDSLKEKSFEDGIRRGIDLYMNGGEIFNFTLKVVPNMFEDLLEFSKTTKEEIDYFVLHQANRYILQNIAKKLDLTNDKLPMDTVTIYGNQNSASIPGTINGFLSDEFSSKKLKVLFAGFGIGLSWGACLVDTDKIYAPKIQMWRK